MILLVEFGVDFAVAASQRPRTVVTVGRSGKIDAEFFLERFTELVAFEFVEQRLERRAEAHLIDGKAAGR